jgi:hypothetical protein
VFVLPVEGLDYDHSHFVGHVNTISTLAADSGDSELVLPAINVEPDEAYLDVSTRITPVHQENHDDSEVGSEHVNYSEDVLMDYFAG